MLLNIIIECDKRPDTDTLISHVEKLGVKVKAITPSLLTVDHRRTAPAVIDKAVEMYESGLGCSDIAHSMGISLSRVQNYVRKNLGRYEAILR
jgi:hypothetical protein